MGEVYKARDTRLDRAVAIKVLAADFAADPQFRERFDREARAISQLTHPNICTLHDVGDHEGTAYLVMELLDGQTLEARLARAGLQIGEALTIAIQIGEALAAAHRAGLVHRDLKPGNVMLTKSGAKLLDFGLAKATGSVQSAGGVSMAVTTPPAMTAQGTIVGTFQYMAPEQIDGHEADARTDIFAFGCVLYEMFAGKKAFEGKSHASLIGAIMHAEPEPLSMVSPLMPASLDRVVRKCLAKDPDARWQSARDLVDELKWIADGGGSAASSSSAPVAARASAARTWLGWAIAGVATLAAVTLGAIALNRTSAAPPAPRTRFTIAVPEGVALGSSPAVLSVSPDGTRIVFAAVNRNDLRQLWLRPLDATSASPIPHTEGASWAFWSPDGRWIGYYNLATSQLMKTDGIGGQSQVICNAATPQGASWNADGVIVYGSPSGVYKVPASGGTPVAVTKVGQGEGGHQNPTFLPDGQHFLFSVFAGGLFVGSIDGSAPREVGHGLGGGHRLVGDELLSVRRGVELISQHVDTRRMTLTGEPIPVGVADAGTYDASAQTLVYLARLDGGVHELTWFDRSGRGAGVLGDRGDYSNVELSPDGARFSIAVLDPRVRTRDIWIVDVSRGVRQRSTFSATEERTAVWYPDGKRLLFNRRDKGSPIEFYQKAADGSGPEEPVLVDGVSKDPLSWSPDGRFLLYRASGATTTNDLWVLPTFGDRKPFPFSATPFDEQDGRVSPDGRWVAYSTDESGQMEVYVARFPSGSGKTRISTAGGTHPRWRRDGKELFYLSLDNKVTAVDIRGAAEDVRVGDTHPLFTIHAPVQAGYNYDVTPDGQRFIVIADVGATPALTVVTNWKPAK